MLIAIGIIIILNTYSVMHHQLTGQHLVKVLDSGITCVQYSKTAQFKAKNLGQDYF